MDQIKKIIHECHRRSLWQVLAVYLVGSWGALQAIQGVTETAGLPDWVPPGALILFMIGLPIVLATAFVQEGMGGSRTTTIEVSMAAQEAAWSGASPGASAPAPATTDVRPTGSRRFFTWRRAIVGGVIAFAVLAASVGVYTYMWSTGKGAVGSLVAQGAMDEREHVLLADFGNATTDSMLSDVVTEALRVDLTESKIMTLMDPAYVREVLGRMERNPNEPFTPEVAREAAVRDGINVVIEGEIGAAGTGYVLTARIVAAADGSVLGAFRETAKSSDDILEALDALSQSIRNKAGESLSDIRETGALEQVTTSSLDALRLYTQAEVVSDQGDRRRAITLLEEATTVDPEFAMAWRKLGVLLSNAGAPVERRAEAARRAYELRDRLTPRERDQATAWYYYTPGPERDLNRAVQYYQAILDKYPDDRAALNNLAVIKFQQQDFAGAAPLLERAVSGPGESATAHQNLIETLYALEDEEGARRALERFVDRYGVGHPSVSFATYQLALHGRRWEEADSAARMTPITTRPALPHLRRANIRVAQGRISEAATYYRQMADVSAVEAYNAAIEQAGVQLEWLEDPAAVRRTIAAVLARHRLQDMQAQDRPLFPLALVYARLGDAREMESWLARNETERAVAAQGDLYQGQRAGALGHLALAGGEFAVAEERYRDARRLQACEDCYRVELGMALAGAGKHEEAVRELEAAAADRRLPPAPFGTLLRAPLVQEQLGRSYEALGRRADAAAAYEKVVDIWKDADAVLQPRVQRARQKTEELRATP
jgi:tetratricopeptide (TPR) repeat protein